jgi:hypothetical protein
MSMPSMQNGRRTHSLTKADGGLVTIIRCGVSRGTSIKIQAHPEAGHPKQTAQIPRITDIKKPVTRTGFLLSA